jgi:hypothetical protein
MLGFLKSAELLYLVLLYANQNMLASEARPHSSTHG